MEDIEGFMKSAFTHLKNGIKASNSLPGEENFNYYKCFPTFSDIQKGEINNLLNLMQGIMKSIGTAGNIKQRDVDEKFDLILEANDMLLDRAALCMDEECGISKNPPVELIVSQTKVSNTVNGSWNTSSSTNTQKNDVENNAYNVRLLGGKNIQRPQISFKDKIDNSSKPWQPRIKEKPNALMPLEESIKIDEDGLMYSHPYEYEIEHFEVSDNQLEKATPIKYKSLEDTALNVIDKVEDLNLMLKDLRNYKELAVDLEHHSYRSFQGITCLMQISTRDTDYLIDTLTLRSELHVLNEIFTNPKIQKVFHGADHDIQWLQRDLSLYVVNMFDTYQAAKQLELPFLNLAYLLKTHCNVDPNKRFQLADWRIRPLPIELIKYAREDTHYLLYIKDILRNALIDAANGQSNILKVVYNRSSVVCRTIYCKPMWTEESFMSMYRKSQKMFNNRQMYALKELHKWRDQTAREEDDSTSYVLPNHMLINIAETLPREMQGILACCNPIPPLVRQNLLKIHKMILKAREQLLVKHVFEDDMKQRLIQRSQVSHSDSWLYASHDIPSGAEIRADLPCLLDLGSSEMPNFTDKPINHIVTVFDDPLVTKDHSMSISEKPEKKKKFYSPYERYKIVLPMVAEHEAKEREKQKTEESNRIKQLEIDAQKTSESINRVHEHFLEVTNNLTTEEASNSTQDLQALNEIPGRKRRRQISPDHESDEDKKEAKMPMFSLDSTRTRSSKRNTTYLGVDKSEVVKKKHRKFNKNTGTYSQRHEDDQNKNTKTQVSEQVVKFNYQSVDFNNFQGGSKRGSEVTKFQQQKVKEKFKGKRNRKKKWNI